jgi:hypothetical protein
MPDPLYGEVRQQLISLINEASRTQNLVVGVSPIFSLVGILMPWPVPRAVALAIATAFAGGTCIMVWAAQFRIREWSRRLDEIAGRHKLPAISVHPFQRQTTRVLLFLALQVFVNTAFIAWLATGGEPLSSIPQ